MTSQEKITMLEEMMELEPGVLKAETQLEEIEEWDSMAALSIIVMMDEEFGKKLTGQQIKGFITVQDILSSME